MKRTALVTCLLAVLAAPAWTHAQSIQEIEARVAEQDAANHRDPYAHFELAERYAQQRGAVARQKMLTHYRIAARMGHTDAQVRLGDVFLAMADDPGVEQQDATRLRSEARGLLEHAANAGNAAAMADLADRLQAGDGFAKDEKAAFAWQRKLADRGDGRAAYAVATALSKGSPEESTRYLRIAADQQVAPAVAELAQRLETGSGVGQDLEAARERAAQAVTLKVPGAAEQLARIEQALAPPPMPARPKGQEYVISAQRPSVKDIAFPTSNAPLYALAPGVVIVADQPPSIQHGERPASLPVVAAAATPAPAKGEDLRTLQAQLAAIQAQLASLQEERVATAPPATQPPPPIEPIAAAAGPALTFEAASQAGPEAGLSPMQINEKALAALNERDMPTALRLFDLAARRGDVNAMNNLGMLHLRGTGVAANRDEAVRWFTMAAERGNAAAASNLGYIYANGVGVTADTAAAITWYRRAANLGDIKSRDMLRTLQGATSSVAWTGQ